uniref:Uncharacterized protein n=1 Tax=Nicotiana tabacum TaxID=4097 RepID=A0A1S4DAC1_TOBAC|nr:PREDICTED: uncharacterized protein LOC107827667 [Nicotiana tabacum]
MFSPLADVLGPHAERKIDSPMNVTTALSPNPSQIEPKPTKENISQLPILPHPFLSNQSLPDLSSNTYTSLISDKPHRIEVAFAKTHKQNNKNPPPNLPPSSPHMDLSPTMLTKTIGKLHASVILEDDNSTVTCMQEKNLPRAPPLITHANPQSSLLNTLPHTTSIEFTQNSHSSPSYSLSKHAETNILQQPSKPELQNKYGSEQSLLPTTQDDYARPPNAKHLSTNDLHISGDHFGSATAVLARDGPSRVCLSVHDGVEQSRSSSPHPEPYSSSRNSDRGNKDWDGVIYTKSMALDPLSASTRQPSFSFHASTLAVQPTTIASYGKSKFLTPSILPSSSYGTNLCTLVPSHGYFQSSFPICESTQPSRNTDSTGQPSKHSSSISIRTRSSNKPGISRDFSRNESNEDRILAVKEPSPLQPRRALRKKVHTEMPSRNGRMQSQLQAINKSSFRKICDGNTSYSSSE